MLTQQHMSLSLYVLLLAVVIAGRTHCVQVVCGTLQLMQNVFHIISCTYTPITVHREIDF